VYGTRNSAEQNKIVVLKILSRFLPHPYSAMRKDASEHDAEAGVC